MGILFNTLTMMIHIAKTPLSGCIAKLSRSRQPFYNKLFICFDGKAVGKIASDNKGGFGIACPCLVADGVKMCLEDLVCLCFILFDEIAFIMEHCESIKAFFIAAFGALFIEGICLFVLSELLITSCFAVK